MPYENLSANPLARVISYFQEGTGEGEALVALLQEGMKITDSSLGALLVLTRDEESQEPLLKTAYLLGSELDPYLDITEKPLIEHVRQTGQPLIIDDLAQDLPLADLPPWWLPRLKKFLAIPLSYRGEKLGQLVFGNTDGTFHPAQLEEAFRIADLSSIVLGTSLLLRQLQGRTQELESLNQISEVINESLDLPEALPLVAEQIRKVLVFDSAILYLVPPSSHSAEKRHFQTIATTGDLPGAELEALLQDGSPWERLLNDVMERRDSLFLGDLLENPLFAVADLLRIGVRSLAVLPLHAQERPLGALVLFRQKALSFSPTDRRFLTAAAEAIAIGVFNAQLVHQLKKAFDEAVSLLAGTVDARDRWTANHSRKVAEYAELIAQEMGLSPAEVSTIKTAALLHDIGKIGIPDDILRKPGELNTAEKAIIMSHPEIGANILSQAGETFRPIVPLVLHHHEWYNGRGYPQGLEGAEIPLGAAILAVADAFEAMTSQRPYRPPLSPEATWRELRKGQGTQFHPAVVEAFHRLWARGLIKIPGPEEWPASAWRRREGALRAWEITAVLGVAQELTRVEDLGELLRNITRFYQEKLGFQSCGVAIIDGRGQLAAVAENGQVWFGQDWSWVLAGGTANVGDPSAGAILAQAVDLKTPEVTSEALLAHCPFSPDFLTDLGPEPRFYEKKGEKGVVITLSGKKGRLGCLYFSLPEDSFFTHGDLDLIAVIAAYLGAVLETSLLLERLRSASETDPLTGLYNRRHFGKRLLEETARAARTGSTFSLAFFDVDDMKEINDTYGHLAGDAVIQWIARFLAQNSRFGDILCRYGGDEFVFILPHTNQDQALVFCQRLAQRFRAEPIPIAADLSVARTLSYGVSTYPQDATTADELLKIADSWMYTRKEKTRRQKAEGG